jgi:hypothetical protein
MTVAQEERAIHEMAHAGQLVRGDDRGDAVLRRLMYGPMQRDGSSRWRGIIDQHDVVSARRGVRSVRRAVGRHETRELAVLDRARVDTAEASETLEQRGRAGTTSAENGDAFSLVHLETGGAKHPDARRASGDAGGVTLPQRMGAKGERHDGRMRRTAGGPTSTRCVPNESIAHAALRPVCPEASYASRNAST